MPSDAEMTLAFVAKRQGTDAMPSSVWAHVLSLELGWMGPGVAKEFIAACKTEGLLKPDGDDLRLGFDRKAVDIPRGFRPPDGMQVTATSAPAAATAASETKAPPTTEPDQVADPFRFLVSRLVDETDLDKSAVLDAVATVQDRFGGKLSGEAAAIHVALTHGLDVRPEAKAAFERITSSAR